MRSQLLERLFVGQIDTMVTGSKSQQAIERTGVKQVPAQLLGQQGAQRALARPARPIDGDYRGIHALSSTATLMPTSADKARKLGKDVATLAQS